MEIRYGCRLRHKLTRGIYNVRAIAPGAVVVLGDVLFGLDEPCPIDHLSIVHMDELDANFELVKS